MDPRQQPPSPDSWWKNGIVYQIYPRSFQDSDGDGIGDLRGIRQRLDYLVSLGVDAVWISPIYPSPMADFGYDISDYQGIDARFGTLADFDELVRGAHARGLKVILDFVPNHTSDRHPWFTKAARRGKTRSATGTCGATPHRMAARPTTGSATSAARPGRSTRPPASTTSLLPARAARPELAQPRGARGDVRGAALLAAPRRGRLPHRCALSPGQGRGVPRQPGQPGVRAGRRPVAQPAAAVHRRPPRGAGHRARDARRGRRLQRRAGRPRAHRRALPAAGLG
jgi:hypothetical protein